MVGNIGCNKHYGYWPISYLLIVLGVDFGGSGCVIVCCGINDICFCGEDGGVVCGVARLILVVVLFIILSTTIRQITDISKT